MLTIRLTAATALAVVALALATGCNGTESLTETGKSKPPRTRLPVSTDKHPVPHEVMDRLYAEVESSSGVGRADIALVRAEEAAWSDASLGCPQPNAEYAQMIVEGYWVILRAGDEEFDYRIDHNLRHRRCTGATKQPPIKYPSRT